MTFKFIPDPNLQKCIESQEQSVVDRDEEQKLWYDMTRRRLAKLGFDVGVKVVGPPPHWKSKRDMRIFECLINFSCKERYQHDIIAFESQKRGHYYEDVMGAMQAVLDEFDFQSEEEIAAKMYALREIYETREHAELKELGLI